MQSPSRFLPQPPAHFLLIPSSSPSVLTWPPVNTFSLLPLPFFDAHPDGLSSISRGQVSFSGSDANILGFVRNPSGSAVGVLREGGGGEVYTLRKSPKLEFIGRWEGTAGEAAVFDSGTYYILCSNVRVRLNCLVQVEVWQFIRGQLARSLYITLKNPQNNARRLQLRRLYH